MNLFLSKFRTYKHIKRKLQQFSKHVCKQEFKIKMNFYFSKTSKQSSSHVKNKTYEFKLYVMSNTLQNYISVSVKN